MENKIIKIDMDDTICYLLPEWIRIYNLFCDASQMINIEDITKFNFGYLGDKELLNSTLRSSHMFAHLKPIEDAIVTIHDLSKKYKIVLVSNAQGNFDIMKGKMLWIQENMPFIDISTQVFFTADKGMVQGDILIEDGPYFEHGHEKVKILIDQLYNKKYTVDENSIRVTNWKEIRKFLLEGEEHEIL